jgi:hypothetical protein
MYSGKEKHHDDDKRGIDEWLYLSSLGVIGLAWASLQKNERWGIDSTP